MQAEKPRKTFLPSLASGSLIAIAIALCAFASHVFEIPFTVHVNIFEIPNSAGMDTTYPYNVSFVANFIAMCVVLNMLFWLACKMLLAKIPGKERTKSIIEAVAIGVIIMGTMGVVFHWSNDHANSLYVTQYGYDRSNLYAYLYFNDEFVGHCLQETALIGYFAVLVVIEQVSVAAGRRLSWTDLPWVAVIVGVMAVDDGYAALHSETAIWMGIASVIMLVAEMIYIKARHPRLLASPLLLATILANVAVIVQDVIFLFTVAISPWYPWIRIHG